jgi:hypothetical protein
MRDEPEREGRCYEEGSRNRVGRYGLRCPYNKRDGRLNRRIATITSAMGVPNSAPRDTAAR